jgi:ABC-type dipeptide/oligopeptide/nickel transport system permease subunit
MAQDASLDMTPEASEAVAELEFLRRQGVSQERGIYRQAVRRFFKNRLSIVGLVLTLALFALAIFADDWFIAIPLGREPRPLLARTPYDKIFFGPSGAFPGSEFWMGTDLSGRDLFSRIVFGTRISLSIGILSQFLALTIGIPLGGIAGWRGGRIDFLVMRVVDVMSAFPSLLFA